MGVLFHPEMLFAFLCGARAPARAPQRPPRVAAGAAASATGLACAAAALTRASAVVVMACVLAAALAGGRPRGAAGYLGRVRGCDRARRGAVVGLRRTHLWGNPLQSNLEREGLMLDRPAALVLHLVPAAVARRRTRTGRTSRTSCCRSSTPTSGATGSARSTTSGAGQSRLDRVTGVDPERARLRRRRCSRSAACAFVGVPAAVRVVAAAPRARRRTSASALPRAVLRCVGLAAFVAHARPLPADRGRPDQVELPALHAPRAGPCSRSRRWCELRRRRGTRPSAALVAVAGLYVVSYALEPRRRARLSATSAAAGPAIAHDPARTGHGPTRRCPFSRRRGHRTSRPYAIEPTRRNRRHVVLQRLSCVRTVASRCRHTGRPRPGRLRQSSSR